jgi:hypothetical protein
MYLMIFYSLLCQCFVIATCLLGVARNTKRHRQAHRSLYRGEKAFPVRENRCDGLQFVRSIVRSLEFPLVFLDSLSEQCPSALSYAIGSPGLITDSAKQPIDDNGDATETMLARIVMIERVF